MRKANNKATMCDRAYIRGGVRCIDCVCYPVQLKDKRLAEKRERNKNKGSRGSI